MYAHAERPAQTQHQSRFNSTKADSHKTYRSIFTACTAPRHPGRMHRPKHPGNAALWCRCQDLSYSAIRSQEHRTFQAASIHDVDTSALDSSTDDCMSDAYLVWS